MTFKEFWEQSGWHRPGEDPEVYGCSEYQLARDAWEASRNDCFSDVLYLLNPAQVNADLAGKLQGIGGELYYYAYGRQSNGDRFQAWTEIAEAYDAIHRALRVLAAINTLPHLDQGEVNEQ